MRRSASALRPAPTRSSDRASRELQTEVVGALACAGARGVMEALTFQLLLGSVVGSPLHEQAAISSVDASVIALAALLAGQVALRFLEVAFRSCARSQAALTATLSPRQRSPAQAGEGREAPGPRALTTGLPTEQMITRGSSMLLAIIWSGAFLFARPRAGDAALLYAGAAAGWLGGQAADRAKRAREATSLKSASHGPPQAAEASSRGSKSSAAAELGRRSVRESGNETAANSRGRRDQAWWAGVVAAGVSAAAAALLQSARGDAPVLVALYAFAGVRLGALAGRAAASAPVAGRRIAAEAAATLSEGARIFVSARRASSQATFGPARVMLSEVRLWDRRTREGLHKVSVELAPGRITAVIGAPGSGVLAFGRVAVGDIAPQSGRLLIDDLELGGVRRGAWRAACARMPAATPIFSGTLEDNLRRGAPEASERALWAALDAAGLGSWVEERGLGVGLGPTAARLTSGEARRLSLARVLLRLPRLLVVEAPLRSISDADAAMIERCLLALRERCTVVMLMPDASGALIADDAVLLEHGRIVESGRMDALLSEPTSRFARSWALA